ncbi:NUDIX hydrolase [Colwellia sp. 1_MG-2023]|uniref:NUDIX hydrolase n=1 Tax=Colwellia sp. 1_MG-2023 TaxID=3062649 RepID=UPI0026E20BB7|nr:NUDIX hydrolase [Colwellia sp. 1_MG-2023]MDO6446902.1 NUDIX hydrolase [Colwellia sp. 1_MG-2023]
MIVCQNKFLLVEELENNQQVFNQPAGHLEANENLIDAVKREIHEETGLLIEPQYCSGIYYFHRPDISLYFLRFCFVIEVDELLETSPHDDEIITTHWLTLDEIKSQTKQLRSPMVLKCIEDYLSGQKVNLAVFKTNL